MLKVEFYLIFLLAELKKYFDLCKQIPNFKYQTIFTGYQFCIQYYF